MFVFFSLTVNVCVTSRFSVIHRCERRNRQPYKPIRDILHLFSLLPKLPPFLSVSFLSAMLRRMALPMRQFKFVVMQWKDRSVCVVYNSQSYSQNCQQSSTCPPELCFLYHNPRPSILNPTHPLKPHSLVPLTPAYIGSDPPSPQDVIAPGPLSSSVQCNATHTINTFNLGFGPFQTE